MRRSPKPALRALALVLTALAAVAVWKREELIRLRAVTTLFDEDRIVGNFSSMDRLFLHREMSGGDDVSDLPVGPRAALPEGFADWVRERNVTAIVLLEDGAVVAEEYFQGTGPADRRISWSVAKSMLSVVLGTLHHDGTIPDLDAQVTDWAPELRGSAYEGATVRNVLNMASGVAFDEDYMDFGSDINRMGRALALGGTLDGFTTSLVERRGEPGADWQYVSMDTHVLGMVMRGATGRTIPELMEERLFRPLGLEADPYYVTDGRGEAFVLGGLNLTTRDYARFGQMVLQGGEWNGRRIVPRAWLEASTVPSAPGGAPYGFQWWIPDDATGGEFFARGVYGQYVYVNRPVGVVIAANGADRGFTRPGAHAQNLGMFRLIADAVQTRPGAPAGDSLVVATYNIRHGRGMDGTVDLTRTAAAIRALGADVIALQEVDRGVARSGAVDEPSALGAELGLDHAFGAFFPYEGGEYGMALLSRFPIRRSASLRLPDGNEPRVALLAELELPSGRRVQVVNVHFDWVESDTFRYAQAEALAAVLDTTSLPTVLLGDFNDVPGSRTMARWSGRFSPAAKPAATRFTFSSTEPVREIDHILLGPHGAWQGARARVVPDTLTSDHLAVVATVRPRRP